MNATRVRYLGAIVVMSTALVASTPSVRPVEPAPAAVSIQELAWLAGHWEGMQGSTKMEEVWLEPLGGVMIGMHRDVFSGGGFFFEHLRIEETGDDLVYYASPRGRQPPTPFRLTALAESQAVFSNPDHDFPQTLTYELNDEGALLVVAAGQENGQRVLRSWTWVRR